jgi:hypothetical protein
VADREKTFDEPQSLQCLHRGPLATSCSSMATRVRVRTRVQLAGAPLTQGEFQSWPVGFGSGTETGGTPTMEGFPLGSLRARRLAALGLLALGSISTGRPLWLI